MNKNKCVELGYKHRFKEVQRSKKQYVEKCINCHINRMTFTDVNERVLYE